MTKLEAREMLRDACDRAELVSGLSGEGEIMVVLVNPDNLRSKVVWEPLVERWYACGWQPAAEYENGERIAEYYTCLDQN